MELRVYMMVLSLASLKGKSTKYSIYAKSALLIVFIFFKTKPQIFPLLA